MNVVVSQQQFSIAVANCKKLRFTKYDGPCLDHFVINDHGEIRGLDIQCLGISRWSIFPLGPRRFGCTKICEHVDSCTDDFV